MQKKSPQSAPSLARTGLVIGKFYPPHLGHSYLINVAQQSCTCLTVILCAQQDQTIPPALRKRWLEEMHARLDVRILDQSTFDDTDPYAWRDACLQILDAPPDLMFTSESYGDEYARLLGARHILVDRERVRVPCSGKQIRANPSRYSQFIAPSVQRYFAELGSS